MKRGIIGKGKVTINDLLTESAVHEMISDLKEYGSEIEEYCCIFRTKDGRTHLGTNADESAMMLMELGKQILIESYYGVEDEG